VISPIGSHGSRTHMIRAIRRQRFCLCSPGSRDHHRRRKYQYNA
jgi:hypothetical protein